MSNRGFDSFIAPLVSFGEQLHISSDIWQVYEEQDQIFYSQSDLSSDLALSLELDQLTRLVNNYQNALSCEFLLGDLLLLKLDDTIDAPRLEQFRSSIVNYGDLTLNLRIDKQQIVKNLFSNSIPIDLKVIFYLFNQSLEDFLNQPLTDIETHLKFTQDCKLVYLVAEETVLLEGKFISVLGGDQLFDVASTNIPNRKDFKQHNLIRKKRYENITWQGFNLEYLTPLYFEFQQVDDSDSKVANRLYNLVSQLILVFTADRSTVKRNQVISIFSTNSKKIEIEPKLADFENTNDIKALLYLFKWVYLLGTDVYDKLSIAQITIVESLQTLDRADYYINFISKSKQILDDSKYRTKAIVEDKISDYIQQELKLEDYVITSTKNFEDEIISLIKNISDTIKGAITAIIGSFIAAVLSDKFNPLIFRISLGIYIGYIIIFPFLLSMNNQNYKFELMEASLEQRILRFKNNIEPSKVDKIIGDRFIKIRDKFKTFRVLVTFLYFVIIFASIWAWLYVPELVSDSP